MSLEDLNYQRQIYSPIPPTFLCQLSHNVDELCLDLQANYFPVVRDHCGIVEQIIAIVGLLPTLHLPSPFPRLKYLLFPNPVPPLLPKVDMGTTCYLPVF